MKPSRDVGSFRNKLVQSRDDFALSSTSEAIKATSPMMAAASAISATLTLYSNADNGNENDICFDVHKAHK